MARLLNSIPKEWGLRLNGSTQYITHTDNAAYDVLDNISISMWFKRAGTGKKFLMSKGTNGFGIYINPSNQLTLTKPNVADLVSQKGSITDQVWHQVVMTLGGGVASVYIDGVFNNSATTATVFQATATGLFIGQDSAGLFLFDGSIKDIRVNNGLWTSQNIAALFAAGPNTTQFTSNLVLWDKVNDGTGDTVTDSSATANNGAITGRTTTGTAPSTMWVIDPVRPRRLSITSNISSVLFNGTSDKIVVADNAALNVGTGDFTYEFKVNMKTVPSSASFQMLFGKRESAGDFIGWENYLSETSITGGANRFVSNIRAIVANSAFAISNVNVSAGRWYHVIVSVTRATQESYRIFVNGVYDPIYSNTTQYSDGSGTLSNVSSLTTAGRNGTVLSGVGMTMYDERLYTRALTDDECLSRYYTNENITSGRVGWWKMNEGNGTAIADSQGSNNGTLTGGKWELNTQS